MEIGNNVIDAGPIKFALQYRAQMADQGVSIQVAAEIEGRDVEMLRFDCFDQAPHYHYGPENHNERIFMDKTTVGNPIGWTLTQLRTRLPVMLTRAGYEDLAGQLDAGLVARKLDEVETTARDLAARDQRTITHNRGDEMIEAGNIRFGLEFRELTADRGLAIHVL